MNSKEFTELVNSHASVRGFVPMELHCGLPMLIKGEGKWLLRYIYHSFAPYPDRIVLGAPACAVQFDFSGRMPDALYRLEGGGRERGTYSEVFSDPSGCMSRENEYFSALDEALAALEKGAGPSPEELAKLNDLLLNAVPRALRDDYELYVSR